MNVSLWCISLSFLSMVFTEASQPKKDRRHYCTFTPPVRAIMNTWLQKHELEKYFTKDNVTVVANAHRGTAGQFDDINAITMKVPVTVWNECRRRMQKNSAYTIISQSLAGACFVMMAGIGGTIYKSNSLSWTDVLEIASTGAILGGVWGAVCGGIDAFKNPGIQSISSEKWPLKGTQETVVISLKGLVHFIQASEENSENCVDIAPPTDKHSLPMLYTQKRYK